MAANGMVTTPHYLASQAALKVLQDGGNAVEAAIAAASTIAVVYPQGNSIGGDNFWLIHDAASRKTAALNASGRSGSLATVDFYRSRGMAVIPARGFHAAVTVPGAVSGWERAYEYSKDKLAGKQPWKNLLSGAIHYAGAGFPVSTHQAIRTLIDFNPKDLAFGNLQRFEGARKTFCDADGQPLQYGQMLRQKDLSQSLGMIAEEGAAAFYRGDIAAAICRDLRENDGVMTAEDFANHRADWVEPISVDYRGFKALNLPPNTQGMAALGILNVLKEFDLKSIPEGSADYYHLMAEAVKAAFADRDEWLTDPEFENIPLDRLLSPAHGAAQAAAIRAQSKAMDSTAIVKGGDTVWIGVVDKAGNAVSLIQSVCDGFGSGIVARNTGVLLQNRGKYFQLDDTSPNRLLPRKRTFHTLIAGMLMKDDAPHLVYGSMGGEGQPQFQTALVTRIVDYGMSPQEAVDAPRWLQGRMLDLSQPGTQLHLEGRIPDSVVATLRRRGHSITMMTDYTDAMGHAGAILIDRETGVLHGAADPRGDGAAVGF